MIKRKEINPEEIITLPDDHKFIEELKILKAVLYKEEGEYHCLVGLPEKDYGIYGHGETIEEAIESWYDDYIWLVETGGDDHDLVFYMNERFDAAAEGDQPEPIGFA